MTDHDPLCPWQPYAEEDMNSRWSYGCQCDLIARVRADEVRRMENRGLVSIAHAEAVAARLVEVICEQEYMIANLLGEASVLYAALASRDAARAEVAALREDFASAMALVAALREDRRRDLSHARPPGHRRTTGAPLCPIHDGDVADMCLCGGL